MKNKDSFKQTGISKNRLNLIGMTSLLLANTSTPDMLLFSFSNNETRQTYGMIAKSSSTRYPGYSDPDRFSLDKLKSNKMIVEHFKSLGHGWNGYSAELLSDATINKAVNILPQLDYQPRVFPTGRGTIQFEYFKKGGDYLEIEIGQEDNYFVFIKSGIEKEGEILNNGLNEIVNEFFA